MDPLRDQRRLPWLDDTVRDVRHGLRTLSRSPGFTVTALLSLALGIGANAGIFSLVDQVLVRSLRGVRDPGQLVLMNWVGRDLATSYGVGPLMSYPLCRELQEQSQYFDGVFCRAPTGVNFSSGQQHEPVRAEIVSGSYFSTIGILPAVGRLIERSDDLQPGAHPVVVLSYSFWRNRLGGSPDVVGRRVLINNYPMTVIGVAQAGFFGVDPLVVPAVWVPATMTELAAQIDANWNRTLDRRTVWMHVFGRLKPGVTAAEAKAGLQPWFKTMLEADTRREGFPNTPADRLREFLASTIDVRSASQGTSDRRDALERPLLVLMAGTVLLLLLASSNVAGLLLARGAARTRELTTRMALGATHARVTRQLLVESLLVTLGGGVLGLIAAPVVSRMLLRFLGPDTDLSAGIDRRVFLFALAVSVVTGALCAIAPALQIRRLSLNERAQGALAAGVGFRKMLVIGQIAFTVILLTGAGLFVQTVARLQAEAPGAASRLVMFRADPPSIGYSSSRAREFMRELARRLEGVTGVEQAAMANTSLLAGGSFSRTLTIQSDERIVTDRPVYGLRVTPGFFSTLGTRVIAGRDFEERDTRAAEDTTVGYRSIIVNESFAKRYLGGRNPVGLRVGFGNRPETTTNVEVIGVIEDLSYISLRLAEREHIFLPFWDQGAEDGTVYLKVRGDPESAFASVRAAVAELDPALPLDSLRTFGDQMDRSLTNERMLATLTSGFGALALLLSVVGLYGVMSLVATRRTQEIGLRLALGAPRSAAVWIVVREALVMVGAGIACAMPVAWALRRMVQAQLFGVGVFDAPTIAFASSGLGVVALGAALVPAWRAALVPPMVAIRDQPESMWHSARSAVQHALRELTAGGERGAAPSVTLISEFTGMVQRAGSFAEALAVALPALRARVGAESIMLLEKARDEYRGQTCSIPAGGLLINRLTHFPHPLPLTRGETDAWLAWAREHRPDRVREIEQLKSTGARIAVALRTKREIVGVLLLGAPEGRETFTDAQKQVLSSAAEVFALMIENARLNDRALEQEKVRRDLALAAEVQRRLLPLRPPSSSVAALAAFTLPARTVGGDYYDFVDFPGNRIGIAVADIAGKGIAAALLMSVVQASLRVIWAETDIPSKDIAARMNRFLHRSTASNGYATFFCAQLDANRRCLRYVNAGHNPPYLVRRTSDSVEITDLNVGGTVLGLFPEVEYRRCRSRAVSWRPDRRVHRWRHRGA